MPISVMIILIYLSIRLYNKKPDQTLNRTGLSPCRLACCYVKINFKIQYDEKTFIGFE